MERYCHSRETKETRKTDKAEVASIEASSWQKGSVSGSPVGSPDGKGKVQKTSGQWALGVLVLPRMGLVESSGMWCRMKGSLVLIDYITDSTMTTSHPHYSSQFCYYNNDSQQAGRQIDCGLQRSNWKPINPEVSPHGVPNCARSYIAFPPLHNRGPCSLAPSSPKLPLKKPVQKRLPTR